MEITANNVNTLLHEGVWKMKICGQREESRNGPVLVLPEPLLVTTLKPTQRVLINDQRNANPYFHFMEGLWMLDGRRDVKWISQFNGKIGDYSDDGTSFHGAYGHRWRKHFEIDQLRSAVAELRKYSNSRRVVIAMWDPVTDLGHDGLDLPCNTHIYLDLRGGNLNMTVCNRSNDIIWGMFGANAVHMSMLQEYLAGMLGCPVGVMRQFSNNAHMYLDIGQGAYLMSALPSEATDPYDAEGWEPFPMVKYPDDWNYDLRCFMDGDDMDFSNPFFTEVALPMRQSWENRKHRVSDGVKEALNIADPAWCEACLRWIASKS